jgi:acetyltransferase-like isoleucine patch superfamily enzyme
MAMPKKRYLALLLTPLAELRERLEAAWRLWAFVRLKVAVRGRLDPSVVILGCPEMHGTRDIQLGKYLYLYRDLYLETRESGRITIGDGVVISRGVHIVAFEEVSIGEGAMIGEYTSLRDANHRVAQGASPRETGHLAKPIRIGRHAWIGRGVMVLPGVTIGDGAVIGANAVVTRDVAPGDTVAGIPAHSIRSRSGRDPS